MNLVSFATNMRQPSNRTIWCLNWTKAQSHVIHPSQNWKIIFSRKKPPNTLPLMLSYMSFGMTNYTVVVTEKKENTSGQIIVHMHISTCLTFLSNNACSRVRIAGSSRSTVLLAVYYFKSITLDDSIERTVLCLTVSPRWQRQQKRQSIRISKPFTPNPSRSSRLTVCTVIRLPTIAA